MTVTCNFVKITEMGVVEDSYQDVPPDNRQVEIADRWIRKYCAPRTTTNFSFSSYFLKHIIENWEHATTNELGYVSNGACILAFLNLGYTMKRVIGPNAYFAFKYVGPKVRDNRYRRMPYSSKEWKQVGGSA